MSIYHEGKAFGWDRPLSEEERKDIESLLPFHNTHSSVHRALSRLLCAEKAANEQNVALNKAIESYTRIEKDMEADCERFLAEIERLKAENERLKAENVRVVATAGAGYEILVEALLSAVTVLGSMPMNDARLWGVYTKLADTLRYLGLEDGRDESRA